MTVSDLSSPSPARTPVMADVARLAGVSHQTVSRVVNGQTNLRPATRERVEQAILDKNDMQFLYRDGDDYVFMDTQSYDQMTVAPAALGNAADYLVESAVAIIAIFNGDIVSVEIPASVELEVTYTEPGLQGDRSSAGTKPATLETGAEIQVPLFLETGTKVKVDTRTGDYLGRVS